MDHPKLKPGGRNIGPQAGGETRPRRKTLRKRLARAATLSIARTSRPRGSGVEQLDPDECVQRAYYLLARRGFQSDRALADAVGVHRSQVSRWSQGKLAQRENAWLLRDVAAAVARLADYFEPETIQKWLFASNPELGDEVPMDLLRQGRLPEILMAVEAQTSGAFA
ncbi:MAG: CII family transcriptional regulator [Longimicrobiaceae bacterium]